MDEFNNIFSAVSFKHVLSLLTGEEVHSTDLKEMTDTSMAIMNFDTQEEELMSNPNFIKAWGIARVKAQENLRLILALLIIRKKYKISNFDMHLFLENFDENEIL